MMNGSITNPTFNEYSQLKQAELSEYSLFNFKLAFNFSPFSAYILSNRAVMVRHDDTVYLGSIKAMRSQNPFLHCQAGSVAIPPSYLKLSV